MQFSTRAQSRHRTALALSLSGIAIAAALTGCATDEQSGAGEGPSQDSDYYAAAVAEAERIAGDQKLDSSLEYITEVGGDEAQLLQTMFGAFTEGTGVKVNYTGSQDSNNVIQSRVQAGNPPDVANLFLGVAQDYASQGKLLSLEDVITDDERANYSESLLESASHDGDLFGVYLGFNNFMVWYNPQVYTGPEPKTWQELVDYTEKKADEGTPTWCIAEEAGASSGFPGDQFIENLFVKMYGAEMNHKWGSGELPWTSPEVKSAWEAFGEIALDDSKVSGGVAGSLSTPIATGPTGLTATPPGCEFVLWGSWVPGMIGAAVEPGVNVDFFPVPGDKPEFAKDEIFQTTVNAAFNDTPTTRAFLQWLASTPAQALLASYDHWPVANTAVSTDIYKSELLQRSAEYFFSDDVTLATGPNVMANAAVFAAFQKGLVAYLQNPDSLDDILATIEAAAKAS